MKSVSCYLYHVTEQGEAFEDWVEASKPHYAGACTGVVIDPNGKMLKGAAGSAVGLKLWSKKTSRLRVGMFFITESSAHVRLRSQV